MVEARDDVSNVARTSSAFRTYSPSSDQKAQLRKSSIVILLRLLNSKKALYAYFGV